MPHINEKIDFTVEVFVVFDNKVLLRKHDKSGIWLSVGGHVELDEDPNQAAIREVKEEVGLDIQLIDSLLLRSEKNKDYTELIPPYFLNRNRITDTHEHITLTYFARSMTDTIHQERMQELSEGIKWLTKEEIEQHDDLLPNIKFYALKALEVASTV